jgi:ketosteroid isomerase-like protein
MHANEQLIHRFYRAFQQKDIIGMQQCYADDATFTDEVFVNLNANEVKAMWAMLVSAGKDLDLTYHVLYANETVGIAQWVATYTFSKTGRKVVNRIQASFSFKDGKIIQHRDNFDFYKWAKQALGFKGFLLGWSSFLRKKVQQTARYSLEKYTDFNINSQ